MFLSGVIVPFILKSYQTDGWRYSWYVLGTLVLVVAGIVFVFLKNQPADKGLLPVGQEKKEPSASVQGKVSSLDWGKVYKMRALWFLGLVYFFCGFLLPTSSRKWVRPRPLPGKGVSMCVSCPGTFLYSVCLYLAWQSIILHFDLIPGNSKNMGFRSATV